MFSFRQWKEDLWQGKKEILFSLLFLIFAVSMNALAGNYADRVAESEVGDLFLSNIPAMEIPYLYVYGFGIVLVVLLLYPLVFKPKKFGYVSSQLALLILIRSFFITLTHLKVPFDALLVETPSVSNILAFQNDLFFSAHTAVPFLGLLLNRNEPVKWFFAASTVILAFMVLVMHLHYSIDVFAAFFITYSSYKLGNIFFQKSKI